MCGTFILISALLVQSGVFAFFDLSDIEDPLSIFWSHKNSLLQDKIVTCTTNLNDGTTVHGVCGNKAQCILTKGLPLSSGTCPGSFSTCCNYVRSCDKTTKSREAYFTSGADVSNYRECNYNIQISNDNVCQIRIDFEKFTLAPPTVTAGSTKCDVDSLTISPNPNGVPQLCGENSGQHVYVAVEEGTKLVTLSVVLKERSSSQALVMPEWKIKIRQLECPKIATFIDKFKNYQAAKDFPLLAPHYAVQYFTERTGWIRTFGFDDSSSENRYTSGQKYAIAFKRSRGVCGIKLTSQRFNLGGTIANPANCEDYLIIPQPTDDEALKYCGSDQFETAASPPGPIVLTFVSSPNHVGNALDEGFKIQYELISSC